MTLTLTLVLVFIMDRVLLIFLLRSILVYNRIRGKKRKRKEEEIIHSEVLQAVLTNLLRDVPIKQYQESLSMDLVVFDNI